MYQELRPNLVLSKYVRCIWLLERKYNLSQPETIWPDGRVELIFHFGERYKKDQELSILPHSFVIGPFTRYFHLTSTGKIRLFGVRFDPWGFMPLFRVPMHLFRNKIVPLYDLIGREANELEERLFEAKIDDAVDILQSFLIKRLNATGIEPDPLIVSIVQTVMRKSGHVKLKGLEQLSGLSSRQLERKFKESSGLSPKKFAVITRFDAARREIFMNPNVDLMDLVHRYGYFDYSHFTKDFRQYFGTTPHAFKHYVLNMFSSANTEDVVFLQDDFWKQ